MAQAPRTEALLNQARLARSNLVALDVRPSAQNSHNNAASGLTATLTWNIFNVSFPDWEEELKLFSTFFWAPRKVVGQGVKNIQWGTKETETFVEYKQGDLIQLKIKGKPKQYESIVPSSNQIKIQVSLDYPPHWEVDKFLDPVEYATWYQKFQGTLSQSKAKDLFQMLRFFFISSAYGACLPKATYQRLLLKTLAQTDLQDLPRPDVANRMFEHEVPIYSPLMLQMIHHKDHFKALSDEMNGKISNINVYSVEDIMSNPHGTRFNPYKPWQPNAGSGSAQIDAQKTLIKCLNPHGNAESSEGWRPSREKSLKAFALVLSNIADETGKSTSGSRWWQGHCGNCYGSMERVWQDSSTPARLYKNNKGTKIMNKPMNERPDLHVVCHKENRILIMSWHDYRDFTSGEYDGWFGSESMGKIQWAKTADKFSEIIPIDGLPDGHAIIMDKRMFCLIPHLEASGTDTIMQRLVTVQTLHQWIIFGLFDQFVGVRIQMVDYTSNPINMNSILFSEKDINLITYPHGSNQRQDT